MPLPPDSRIQLTPDFSVCRILNGLWQVSGGHGAIDPQQAIPEMVTYLDAGFTTWDLADHYGPAEDLIGQFRRQIKADRGEAALPSYQALTKWVPRPGAMTRPIVEQNIDISRRRMDTPTLDMVQFHWWEYQDPRYLDALKHMVDLQREGKIRYLGLTNFDTERLQIILDHGIPVLSNQVQFSIIDQRPLVQMAAFCEQRGIKLFAYGTLCGGFLSDAYLGQAEPGRFGLKTVSQRKYKQMIDAWGSWREFQALLTTLRAIADQYGVSVANVAVRYVLEQPAVAGAIVGARLSIAQHLQDNVKVFDFSLSTTDHERIKMACQRSQNLFQLIGDCGDEYRR